MASFKAELEVDGETYKLKRVFFTATRKRDNNGRPASATNWQIMVALDAIEEGTFTEWMVDPKMQKDATVKFYNIDEDSVLKQWDMKGAYCYAMKEWFVSDASVMVTNLIIAGQEISNGNATLKFDWK